ncbi:MAG: Ku protein [Streptosporangiaceae bacterium]
MHSMWKGSISFGLVMIPVKLYAATEQKDIAFRQVHRTDGGRIRFRRVCSIDGEEIPYEQVAKGFELPSGEMIVLTDEDMADLPLPTTRSIEVLHFMPADQLDPILLSRSYYVEPESAGARAYVLLRDSLDRSGKVALAIVALRQRESLATLRSRDGVLVLETLLWPDEVRTPAFGFLDDDIEVRSQELKMAASLIDSMTVDFDPDEYHDGYREALQELVNAKAEGREVIQPEEGEIPGGEPTSLADALKASLTAARLDQRQASAGSGSAASGGAASGGAGSGSSGSGRSAGGRSAGGRSAEGRPGGGRSASGGSDGGSSAGGSSAGTKPGSAKTAGAKSGGAKSDGAKSDGAKSDGAKSDGAKSDGAKSDGAKPDSARTAAGQTAAKSPPSRSRRRAS